MSLKKMVNDPSIWKAFVEYLDQNLKDRSQKSFLLRDPVDVYRSQGACLMLSSLKNLRDEVNAKG